MVLGKEGRCPPAILLPFTDRGRPSKDRTVQSAFTHMASSLMAMEDFNNRDSSIVPQLADDEYSLDECNVYFPLPWHEDTVDKRLASIIKDDGDKQDQTANALLWTLSHMRHHDEHSEEGAESHDIDDAKKNHHLCAVAGSMSSLPARTASTLSAASDVPYFSHGADTTKISRPPIYPLSGKTGSDEYARGDAVISYLDSIGRDKVVLVYTHTNEDVLKVTSKAARDYGVDLRYEPVSPPLDGKGADTPYDAMRRIKESGFKTVILSVTRISILEHIAREAERWGVNTDDYVWLVWESATELETLANTKTERGSEMDKLLRGMGSVRTLDGYDWRDDDSFLARWKSRDVEFVEKLNAINPIVGEGKNGKPKPGYFRAEPDYFQNFPPMPFSSYMYDTVIALGMGACRTQKIQRQLQVEAPTANDHDEEGSGGGAGALIDEIEVEEFGALRRLQVKQGKLYKPGPNLQYNETLKVTFDGASGFVKLDNGMIYTRDEETIGFGVYNLRPVDTPDETTYEYAITSKRIPGGQWAEVPGVSFVYADGSNIQPTPVREVFENNFLSPSVRAGGFALFSIAAFICIGLAAWTFAKRNSSIVRAAQPEFLYLLCFGSLASLMAIITLSFDESYGTSVETLSAMCTATPWLFCTGYMIVYMALFSKLYRINKVLQFRRRQVKAHHVVLPAVVLILLALIVLALWTALDPYVWVRETVDDESGETFGTCTSNNATAYIVTLSILVITATLLAFVMAYKTRDLPGKYTDAGPIFFGIVAQLEVWFVGIPILVIVDNVSADAMYLARVLIIWIFAVIMVLTVIGSKFLQTYGCWNAHSHQQSDGVHYSGGGTVHISGMTSSNELFCSKRGLTTGDSKGGENRTSGTTNPGGSASVLSAQQVSNPSLDIALSRGSSSVAPLNSSSNGSAPAAQVEPELTP